VEVFWKKKIVFKGIEESDDKRKLIRQAIDNYIRSLLETGAGEIPAEHRMKNSSLIHHQEEVLAIYEGID
jgi:hypothetical protein